MLTNPELLHNPLSLVRIGSVRAVLVVGSLLVVPPGGGQLPRTVLELDDTREVLLN